MVSMYPPGEDDRYARIACTGFGRIFVDDKFLVCLNRRKREKGRLEYAPFGGAYKFTDEARSVLKAMGAIFDYEYLHGVRKNDRNDLRFLLQNKRVGRFDVWYALGNGQYVGEGATEQERIVLPEVGENPEPVRKPQRDLYPFRELEGELIDEEGVLSSIEGMHIGELFRHVVEPHRSKDILERVKRNRWVDRADLEGLVTYRYTEIYNVHLSDEQKVEVRCALERPDTHIALLSPDDITIAKNYHGVRIAPIMLEFLKMNDKGEWVLEEDVRPTGPMLI